ncbi:MAG: InlB B-repeat-containing protein, partial [Lachnospiraceae bacterium]
MGKKGFLGRVILFVSALFMLVVFPVYNAKAETNYILTEDGKLVEDTNAYHSQIEPHVSGINIAAETAAPAKVEWCESFTTGVSFDREAGKYYKVQLLCEGTVMTTVNVEAVSTADTCFIPLVVTMESKSYGLFTVNVYETDSSYNNISGATTSDEYEYVKPTKQLAAPSGLSWSGTTLSWSAVSGMTGIRYLVDKVDTSSSTGYTYLGERIVANVNNTLDISDFISQYGDGQYRVRMYAVTNANVKKQSAMAVSDNMSYPVSPTDPDDPSTAHSITVTSDGNGTASSLESSAVMGTTVTIYVYSVNTGYEFDKWVVESGEVTLADPTSNMQTFTMPNTDVVIKATFKLKGATSYGITVTNDGNGSASANVSTAAQGTTVTVTATPNSGYKFKEWQVVSGGVTLSSTTANPATFTMGSTAVQVKAVFEQITYGITVTNDGNGSASANVNTAASGTKVTITANPNNGYEFKEWQVVSGGVTLSSTTANPATFTMGSTAVQVKAVFEQITYG